MQIYLQLSGHPKANVKRIALSRDTIVGRSKTCGLRIVSPGVSRKHCEIRIGEESAVVVDLGSSNGTFVANERIAAGEEHPLDEGVRLNIGGIRFLVSYTSPGAAKSAPEEDPIAAAISAAAVEEPAAGTAPAASEAPPEDEPLPLEDDDDLIGLADEPEPGQDGAAAEQEAPQTAGSSIESESPLADDEPLVAEDSLVAESGDVAQDDAIVPDEEEISLIEEDAPSPALEDESRASEPAQDKSAHAELLESETQSNGTDTDTEAIDREPLAEVDPEDDLLSGIEDDEPILVDEEEDTLDADKPSESDLNLDDSARFSSADGLGDDAGEESLEAHDRQEESTGDDEPILDVDDEDQAFSFLDDDDDADSNKATKSGAADSKLGDFLNQFDRK